MYKTHLKKGGNIIKRYFKGDGEVIACMVEISSELGYILDEGVNPDSMEAIELLNNRIVTLLGQIDDGEKTQESESNENS